VRRSITTTGTTPDNTHVVSVRQVFGNRNHGNADSRRRNAICPAEDDGRKIYNAVLGAMYQRGCSAERSGQRLSRVSAADGERETVPADGARL